MDPQHCESNNMYYMGGYPCVADLTENTIPYNISYKDENVKIFTAVNGLYQPTMNVTMNQ